MGGYGAYVWWSFGICYLLFVGELISLIRNRKATYKKLGKIRGYETPH
jgi:heme exporter protein CcmD